MWYVLQANRKKKWLRGIRRVRSCNLSKVISEAFTDLINE